jgi:hypothetical protein
MINETFTFEEALAIAKISRLIGACLGPDHETSDRSAKSRQGNLVVAFGCPPARR